MAIRKDPVLASQVGLREGPVEIKTASQNEMLTLILFNFFIGTLQFGKKHSIGKIFGLATSSVFGC
jgi:hypothetical protein